MRRVLFFSRVAFLCNICFLLAFSIQLTNWVKNEELKATIIMVGYVMGFIVNPLIVITYILVFIIARNKLKQIPSWLMTANILFLVIQILYIFYLNDTQHT
jgi:hypothetical protein